MRRKKPVQQRAKVTADSILEAAEKIMLTEGYERANTNRIAEVAGVSIGSLYQYFPDKEAIATSLIEKTISEAAVKARQVLHEMMEAPLEEASRKINLTLLEIFEENEFVLYVLPEKVVSEDKHLARLALEKFMHYTNVSFLEQHQQDLTASHLKVALHVITVATMNNIENFVRENPTNMTRDQFIDEMVRLFVSYMTFPKGKLEQAESGENEASTETLKETTSRLND